MDIETLGLLHHEPLPEITCVCMHTSDGDDHMLRIWGLPDDERTANIARIIALLDDADIIAGYNAVLFDLEFMRRAFHIDDARALSWTLKCLDPLMCARYITGAGCRMQRMLELNGLGSKTGSGSNAIDLARNGEWEALLDYCLMDARLTYQLCAIEWLRLTPYVECRLDMGRSPPQFRIIINGGCDDRSSHCANHDNNNNNELANHHHQEKKKKQAIENAKRDLAAEIPWVCVVGVTTADE